MNLDRDPVAVTSGDPGGVGSEILLKAWLGLKHKGLPFAALHNIELLTEAAEQLGIRGVTFVPIRSLKEVTPSLFERCLPVLNIELPYTKSKTSLSETGFALGKSTPSTAKFAIHSLEKVATLLKSGEVSGVVTLPIEKSTMQIAGFNFVGHTEFFAAVAGIKNTVMGLVSEQSRAVVCPLTLHTSLSNSIAMLSKELIVGNVKTVVQSLSKYLGKTPKIAILGLNPHAGEDGLMGSEETTILKPAIKDLLDSGLHVVGPLPADTVFTPLNRIKYDVIFGMYHDQVLTPFKALYFDSAVNVTLGLPFVRTSPAHGTALDIAKVGVADEGSLISAIRVAHKWQDQVKIK